MLYLRFLRLSKKLTGKEVALRAKVNRSIYIQMEMGRVNPTPDELARIAKVLGVNDPARLLTRVNAEAVRS